MNNPACFDVIRLNGQTFTPAGIVEHSTEKMNDPQLEEWEKELYHFYIDWFNTKNPILGKLEIQSSGSTGNPKKLFFSREQMIISAIRTGKYLHLDQMNDCLLCLPMKYIAGKMMVVRAMQHRLDLLTVKPTTSPLERIDRSIDFAAMTPQQVYTSLSQGQNLNCIKKLIIGGGEVTQALKDLLQPLNTKCFATYGMTETLTHIALQRLNGSNAQSAFECLPEVEVWTDDRSCLVIKTPYLTETIVTNDVVEMIGKNRFRWVGRSDNVINSGGIKIFPELVEKHIEPLVKGSFFIASRPDVSLGERLILILEGEEPGSENKWMMMDAMKRNLAPYHCPKEIVFLPKFVYTETGKINRRKTLEIIFFKHFGPT